MKRNLRAVSIVLVLLFLVGCPYNIKKMSQDDLYYKALGIWYSLTDNFEYQYNKPTTTPEQQSLWGREFAPMLLQAKELLDLWKRQLNSEQPTIAQQEEWRTLRNDLIRYFAEKIDKKGV